MTSAKDFIQEVRLVGEQNSLVERMPQRAPRLLYAGAVILIVILMATNVAVILHLRESELLYQEAQLKNLSLIMAEHAQGAFLSVELAISSVEDRIKADGVTDIASFDEKMPSHDLHILFREKISGIPQLNAITVLDRDGKVINYSRSWPIPDLDASDRAYFHALKDEPGQTSYVSEPVRNHGTGTWTIFLAHRISGAKGEFLGIILGGMEMRYFEDFYQAISQGEGEAINLMRLDGVILARYPRSDAVGTTFYPSDHILHGNVSGTLRERSFIDGQMRIKAAHLVSNFPVFALTTKTEESALSEWRRVALLMWLGALGTAISIAFGAFALGRKWQQQTMLADTEAELRRQEERTAALATASDVARTTAARLTYLAEHDPLTGLPNRILLNDRIGQAIALARRRMTQVGVVFLDLDGFKHINDALGHSTGDKLLQSIAARLVTCVRGSDTVSRQGGDEFIVLLSEVEHPEGVSIVAERLVRALGEPISIDQHNVHLRFGDFVGRMLREVADPHLIDGHSLHIAGSIGISVYPDDGQDAETLIQNADTAMYKAKDTGLHGYQFFEPDMNIRAVERQFIEEGLRGALAAREFVLHYQPIVDLKTGAIIGAEGLIRWNHPTRGLITPAQFISVAEDCGLIIPIGKWVTRESCQHAKAWADAGLPIAKIAVNVSSLEFRDENFVTNLLATLEETGLDPKLLVLELTESVLMQRAETTASILQVVRQKGARVAIDDFGTGYSSLSYLRKFPVDILKIDQSFVRQISASEEDRAIVTAVIGLAHNLRLRVIAEGVETQDELAFLRDCQCDEVQGYYFSRPLPADAFAELLRTGIQQPQAHVVGVG